MLEPQASLAPPPPPATSPPLPLPFLLAIVTSLGCLALITWPVRVPVFFAMVFAIASRPFYERATAALGNRPRITAALLTLLFLLCIVVPLGALATVLAGEVSDGLTWVAKSVGITMDGSPDDFPNGLELGLSKISDTLHLRRQDVRSFAEHAVGAVQGHVSLMLGVPLGLFGGILLLLIGFYFFTVDGHMLSRFLLRASPLRPKETHELLVEFRNTCSGALLSTACNCAGQGLVLFAGFAVAGVPHALFFGIFSVFAALIPLVGSFLVWIPAVVILGTHGRTVAATALAVWSFVMVALVDNTVKPMVLRGKLDMHGGLLLLGFVGGATVFGPLGLIAGPLIVAFVVTLLRIYQRDYLKL